jgi:hypothetical protein
MLDGDSGDRVGSIAEQGHLTQQVALAESVQDSLLSVNPAPRLDGTLMDQVGFALRLIAFPEDHISGLECLSWHVFDLLSHGPPPGDDDTAVRGCPSDDWRHTAFAELRLNNEVHRKMGVVFIGADYASEFLEGRGPAGARRGDPDAARGGTGKTEGRPVMERRTFLAMVPGGLLTAPLAAEAQPAGTVLPGDLAPRKVVLELQQALAHAIERVQALGAVP